MRLIRAAIVAAIAKKVVDEARKPENQRRLKQMMASAQERGRRRRP
jgi:hypothetical protein